MAGNTILFSERQRFRAWWFWAIIALPTVIGVYGCVQQIGFGIPFGDKPLSNAGIITVVLCFLAFNLLFLVPKLETQVGKDGIYVRFYPLHRKFIFYPWADLVKCYVRQYRPIGEYGGWGWRASIRSGTAYNISGNMGLQLEHLNGAKLLIGTRKPEELEKVLSGLGQLKAEPAAQ